MIYAAFHVIQGIFSISTSTVYGLRSQNIIDSLDLLVQVDEIIKTMNVGLNYKYLRGFVILYVHGSVGVMATNFALLPTWFGKSDFQKMFMGLVGFSLSSNILLEPLYNLITITYACDERFNYLNKITKKLLKCEDKEELKIGLRKVSVVYEKICLAYEKMFFVMSYHVLIIYLLGFFQTMFCLAGLLFGIGNFHLIMVIFTTGYFLINGLMLTQSARLQDKVQ